MLPKLGLVLVLLVQALAGLLASEFMLCFHRDGRIEVEALDLLCCKDNVPAQDCEGEASPISSPCPDDSCQDMPLAVNAVQSLETPPAIERVTEVPLALAVCLEPMPQGQAQDEALAVRGAGPPTRSGPSEHLRTIVLRI